MRFYLLLVLAVYAPFAFADSAIPYETKHTIPYFESVTVLQGKITIVSKVPVGKTRNNEPDDVDKWALKLDFEVGDTARVRGGQVNLYWKLLDINKDKAKFHYFGFERGKGTVDDIFWLQTY